MCVWVHYYQFFLHECSHVEDFHMDTIIWLQFALCRGYCYGIFETIFANHFTYSMCDIAIYHQMKPQFTLKKTKYNSPGYTE